MIFLSRKQLLLTAILSMVGEITITIALLAVEYMGWLNNMGQNLILWVFFPFIALVLGWFSHTWTDNWFVALLVPLLVYTSFILVSMNNAIFLAFVPLYVAASLGGYYLFGLLRKKRG
jgi:hypothetical protein